MKLTELIEELQKACSSKLFNDDGKRIEDKLRQHMNALFLIRVRRGFGANVIDWRPLSSNADLSISSTFAGISIDVKLGQDRNKDVEISPNFEFNPKEID